MCWIFGSTLLHVHKFVTSGFISHNSFFSEVMSSPGGTGMKNVKSNKE